MKKTMIILSVLVSFLLANCANQLPATLSNAERVTIQALDTQTLHLKPSETITPTYTPTNKPTLTPTLTWTPLPTLSPNQAKAKIDELLATNGGCELPCWWGITPNKTAWADALHYISPYIFQLERGSTDIYIENGKKHTYTNFQFYYYLPDEAEVARITLSVKDGVVLGMSIYPPATEYKYQLHQLLTLLGPPKQVLISAQASAPIPVLPPTIIILDYSNIGVWASYGYIPTLIGENLVICPKPSSGKVSIYDNVGGRLELFDPKMENSDAMSIEEYSNMIGGFTAQKLENVTNMTMESFYNTFVDSHSKTCLETSADLWP